MSFPLGHPIVFRLYFKENNSNCYRVGYDLIDNFIGVGRFRILGGQGLEYWGGGGGQGGPNSQQTHDVVMTSMRRNNVASTSFRRHVPTTFLINQCQIITFHILKSDIVDRIERNSFVSTFKSNYRCIYYYFTLQLGTFVIFSCFT